MVEMHEMVPGKRFDRYHELGQHVFGEKLGLWVVPQQLMVEVGSSIVYMITGGKYLKKAHDTIWPNYQEIKLTYFIMIFPSVHFVFSHLPSFNSITAVSLAAGVIYSTIAWVLSWHKGVQPDVQYTSRASTNTGQMFDRFSALGDIAFAFAGHSVALEIQATIPSTPGKPSKKPMWKGVVVAYLAVALCFLPVSFIGYWVFGNKVEDNILLSLEKPRWLVAVANLFVVIHVIGSYQVFAMPVFVIMEAFLVLKMNIQPGQPLRFITRILYVVKGVFFYVRHRVIHIYAYLSCFNKQHAKLKMPQLFAISLQLPRVMWLAIYKPKKFSLSWLANWQYSRGLNFFSLSTDMHYPWRCIDGISPHWSIKADNTTSQGLPVLLLTSLLTKGMLNCSCMLMPMNISFLFISVPVE
ncbi:hypothetical protein NC653_010238 [Populus alba x Populus x berolinensis]|uniref:Amino acid transporter transmembrane domain-containing protein n=1 Tax=Populus alba x Populus x berolinensis TaxID=444605 RepID=A0AAD6W668_9ROSI|nr:hypothetical protein NC653_010238 [Populus alba x Populus x berolinensis]